MKARWNLHKICLLSAMWLLPAAAQAQFTFITNADNTIAITGYTGSGGDVTIPGSIGQFPVTSIGKMAFAYSYLGSVTIPDSVTNIGYSAFSLCRNLTNVTFGQAVASIGSYGFSGCSALTSVTLPNSVTTIAGSAFANCHSLTSVTMGNRVASLGDDAFYYCQSLTNLMIPDSVTSIGYGAFAGCGSLAKVQIPHRVTSLGDSAFADCGSLVTVQISDSVTSIGYDSFDRCGSLTAINVDTNNPAYSSSQGVFFDKRQTTLIHYPAGNGATSYTIPNSVTSINFFAFQGCLNLTNLFIPESVAYIGDQAFAGCSNLTAAYFQGNAPSLGSTAIFSDNGAVYYLPGTLGWSTTFDGRPTAPWTLPYPVILNHQSGFGLLAGRFHFTISWATNLSVVVEASTNLFAPVWLAVQTNTLTGGSSYFGDPQWTNYPQRYYRLRSP